MLLLVFGVVLVMLMMADNDADSLSEFLPPTWCKVQFVEEDVYKAHRRLKGSPLGNDQ